MKEYILIALAVMGIVIVGALVLGTPLVLLEKYSCSQLEKNIDRNTEYHIIGGGCLVEVNGRMIPRDNWRGEYER